MIVRALLRAAGSTIALVVIYYLLPLNRSSTWAAVTMLVIGLVVFTVWSPFRSARSRPHRSRDCGRSKP
jgi:hypothetical protein